MAILDTPDLNELRKQIQKIKKEKPEEKIIVQAGDCEFNRKILEIKDVKILLGPEIHSRKDKIKQIDTGLNETLCKIAKKNDICIGIDLEKISKMSLIEKSKVLARVMQNLRLCRKSNTKIFIYPEEKYSKQDVLGFFTSLGASTQQVKNIV